MHHPQPASIYMFEIENPIISLDNKVTWSMTLNFKIDTNFDQMFPNNNKNKTRNCIILTL